MSQTHHVPFHVLMTHLIEARDLRWHEFGSEFVRRMERCIHGRERVLHIRLYHDVRLDVSSSVLEYKKSRSP